MDPNDTKTTEPSDQGEGSDGTRLPWKAPVLNVYDIAGLTLGPSDQSDDGGLNTHS